MSGAILFSIKTEFAERIYSGSKRTELRRNCPSRASQIAFLYETKPRSAITGAIQIARIRRDTPAATWARSSSTLGISRSQFDSYLRGSSLAVSVEISRSMRFDRSIALHADIGVSAAPQSFCYLSERVAARLLELQGVESSKTWLRALHAGLATMESYSGQEAARGSTGEDDIAVYAR
ncbi:MAG: hypothetical protein KGJ23_13655 [Euryarchaeota archaeon]|nr:hypothetical protein [Euryarchaeota archaeon]MDE2045926.1 hypothetical protein [Thermoplasmata archaeon]